MRLRLLLPRRGRGRGLRSLRRAAFAGAVLALAIAGCGGNDEPKPAQKPSPTATPTPEATATATPSPKPKPPALADMLETRGRHLAVGISEQNPNFISSSLGIPQPFARWRDALARMKPALYRLVIYWPSLQPSANAPADLAGLNAGCVRDKTPCAGYEGIRDQLRALATRQAKGEAEGFAMITGTPEWAARPPSGCERSRIGPTNRMPRADALNAYKALVRNIVALARKEGATLRYWAPWNEPNHPYSSSPQRAYCSGSAPNVSVGPYVEVVNALREALAEAPGEQRYVVGEVAVMTRRLPITTSVHEFLQALPAKLVCRAAAWTQHTYIGGLDVLGDVDSLLSAKGCKLPIWMTETGAGAPRTSSARTGGRPAELRGCRDVHRILTRWYRDRRITAAIQYTLREDDVFPTGLVTTDLSRAYPVLHEWQQWGERARPSAADPPPAKAACG
jgi:hypothetical protein